MIVIKFFTSVLICLTVAIPAAAQSGSVSVTGISNRFIAPNGKNLNAVVRVSNPQCSDVTGKIYDIQGRFVADMTLDPLYLCSSVSPQHLTWDGKGAKGQIVRTGAYVFVISAEGFSYRGVLVVIR